MAGELKLEMNGSEIRGVGAPKVKDVLSQVQDILEILNGVENAVAEDSGVDGDAIEWHITGAVKSSPFVLELTPHPRKDASNIESLTSLTVPAAIEGIRFLMESGNLPPYFSGDMVKITRRICRRVTNGLDTTIMTAPTYADAPIISITKEKARDANSNLKRLKAKNLVYRQASGTIEGKITKIGRENDEGLIVWMESRVDGKIIKCVGRGNAFDDIGDNMIAEIAQGLQVLVSGTLNYAKPGKIAVIETDEIRVIEENEDSPRMRDFADPNSKRGSEINENISRIRNNEIANETMEWINEIERSAIAVDKSDPFYETYLRGLEMKGRILTAEGGALSGKQFSERLGIATPRLDRMRMRNQVFWLDVGKDYVYPFFQLGKEGLLPGIQKVLDAFMVDEAWMRVNFMISGDLRLDGGRPIDLIRDGRIGEVVLAASAYGEHGAV